MTLVKIDIRNVASETHPDDRVLIRSATLREASGGGLISTAETSIPLVDGVGEVELAPGSVVVNFQCRGISDTSAKSGIVPDEGTVDIADVISGSFTYTPPVINDALEQITTARDEALGQVAGAVDEAVGEHLSSIAGDNILNLTGALPGYSLSPDGSVSPTPTRTTTDFIPVEGSTQYVWSVDGEVISGQQIIYQAYSADKTLVGGQRTVASFVTTSTTRFIRASILTDVLDKAQLEKGTTPTPFVAYGGLKASDITISGSGSVKNWISSLDQSSADLADRVGSVEALAAETSSMISYSHNILDLSGALPGYSLSPDGSVSPTPTRTTTDFIPVEGSTQYVWSVDGEVISGQQIIYQAYSADKTLVGGQRTVASFVTTSTTRFIRASILTDVLDKAQLEKGTTPTPYAPHGAVSVSDLVVGSGTSVSIALTDLMSRVSALEGAPPPPTPGVGATPQSLLSWEQIPHPGRKVATAYDGNLYFYTRIDGLTRMVKSVDSGDTIAPGMLASDTPAGSNGIVDTVVWEDGSVVHIGFDGRIYRASAFDAVPTLVYQTNTGNTLHGISNSSYSDGAGKRYVFAGEYDHTSTQKSMFYSRDGGDTWNLLLQGGTLNAGNNHWHSVAYDPYRDAVWVSEGDGDNSKVGITFDWGVTWEWLPQNHPTSMYAFPDRVVMGRDKSGMPPGISQSDGTIPLTITDALSFRAEDRGSFHFYPLRTSWNQWNDTYYILFPARHEDDTDSYIWATGDGGESWHLVSNGAVPQINLAGIDSHGYLYAGTGGAVDSPLYRAKAVTWL